MANTIMTIVPYWENGTWVFDDARVGLQAEPFVAGIPEMIDDLVRNIPDARHGFRMTFSAQSFPGFQRELIWLREEYGGNWYRLSNSQDEGWLCPAMFHYFESTPEKLYVKAESKVVNVPGFSANDTFMYAIDDYSTPDKWYKLGFELQYSLSATLDDIVTIGERDIFIQKLINTFMRVFSLRNNQMRYHRWVDDSLVRVLHEVFDVAVDEEAVEQPFRFYIRVFHDKGPFDLRILKQLESEINQIAIINRARVKLTKLIIIPRSRETIASKINSTN
ncbi:DUF6717 family protein [Chloroflexota bacterium]